MALVASPPWIAIGRYMARSRDLGRGCFVTSTGWLMRLKVTTRGGVHHEGSVGMKNSPQRCTAKRGNGRCVGLRFLSMRALEDREEDKKGLYLSGAR